MCLPDQSARDAVLAELAALDPTALDAAGLMGQISDLAAFISLAQAQLARLTGALDATGGARGEPGTSRQRRSCAPGAASPRATPRRLPSPGARSAV